MKNLFAFVSFIFLLLVSINSYAQDILQIVPESDSIADLSVTINPIDTCVPYESAVKLYSYCFGGTQPYQFKWTPASMFDGSQAMMPYPTTKPLTKETTFYVKVTDAANTIVTDSMTVCVSPQDSPKIFLPNDTIICCGYQIALKCEITGGLLPYKIHWTPDSMFINPNIPIPITKKIIGRTTFYITVTDSAGNIAKDSITVDCDSLPNVSISAIDTCVPYNTSVQLHTTITGGIQPYYYIWRPDSLLDNSNIANPTTKPLIKTTHFYLSVMDTIGCVAKDTIRICVTQNNDVLENGLNKNQTFFCIPNPASDKTKIEFETSEFGYTEVFITDMLGNTLKKVFETTEPGKYNIDVDLSIFNSGIYTCILRTPAKSVSKMFVLVK
jgi:hypothetical protein